MAGGRPAHLPAVDRRARPVAAVRLGLGPRVPGADGALRETLLFCAWPAWSRFRVVIPTTYIVTNAADSGPGSLRDALTRANTLPGTVDTILFDAGFFAAPRTITLTSGELPVTDSVTIFGPGRAAYRHRTPQRGTGAARSG